MRWEGKEVYGVAMMDDLQNPIVHADLAPTVGEEGDVASKDDGW